jgi:hypothetical protein
MKNEINAQFAYSNITFVERLPVDMKLEYGKSWNAFNKHRNTRKFAVMAMVPRSRNFYETGTTVDILVIN